MPTIHEGNYWNYEMSGEYGTWSFEGTVHDKITGETTIIVDGQSYEVWVSEITTEWSGENLTMLSEGKWYVQKSDYANVKSAEYINSTYPGGSSSSYIETTYKPVQPDMEFPIGVEDVWDVHKENQVTDETGTHTVKEDTYYECTGKDDVTTDAGTFSCYVIKRWNNVSDTGNYTISYYSNEVGGAFVKMDMYTDNIPTMTITLTSYKYKGKDEDNGIPGFELTYVVIAVFSALILIGKRKK
jgi:hypothetical protein